MRQSPTGKPLCTRCRKLATHRIMGFDRITRRPVAVYQCDGHKHPTSEPIAEMNPAEVMMSREDAEQITRLALQRMHGSVDENEVLRIVAEAQE